MRVESLLASSMSPTCLRRSFISDRVAFLPSTLERNWVLLDLEAEQLPLPVPSFSIIAIQLSMQSEVGVGGQVGPSQEAVEEHLGLLALVLGDHVSGPLHRGEHEPIEFPDHAADLVLVLVEAGDPPLPPLVEQLDPELVPEPDQPGHGASDWYAVVDVALGDPDPDLLLHEDGVEPVAGVLEHDVVVADLVAAGLELFDVDVEVGLDGPLVEVLVDAVHVLADEFALHEFGLAVGEADVGLVGGVVDLLVEALRVEVEHAGVGPVELGVHDLADFPAGVGVVAHGAGAGDLEVLIFGVVAVVEEVLVLVDAHVDVVAGLPALARVGAGVVNHYPLQVYLHLRLGQLVGLHYLVGQVGDVDARVALAGYVELVVLQVGELLEELHQGLVVVLGHRPVVVHLPRLRLAETHAPRRRYEQQVRLHVPGVFVYLEV